MYKLGQVRLHLKNKIANIDKVRLFIHAFQTASNFSLLQITKVGTITPKIAPYTYALSM